MAEACAVLLGGGTLSAVMREWTAAGVRPGQSRTGTWTRQSIRTILLNPRIAGLSVYKGEIVGQGMGAAGERGDLAGGPRNPGRPRARPAAGVRTLLGGLAVCPCANVVVGQPSHTGHHIYRCAPATRNRDRAGGHVARQAKPVEDYITAVVIGRMTRPDVADLLTTTEGGPDVAGLRGEAAAIRANLEEMATDRALGLITRAQMLKATERANTRLAQVEAELADAARENVPPLTASRSPFPAGCCTAGQCAPPGSPVRAERLTGLRVSRS